MGKFNLLGGQNNLLGGQNAHQVNLLFTSLATQFSNLLLLSLFEQQSYSRAYMTA